MVIYGVVLVLIVMFLPRGLAGSGRSVRAWWGGARPGRALEDSAPSGRARGPRGRDG